MPISSGTNQTHSILRNWVAIASAAWIASAAMAHAAFETAARAAFVVDLGTGTVLFEKEPEVPLPPASMSKLMTLNMLFEALRDGRVTMDTEFGISNKAHRMGGSKMFLRDGGRVAVKDLIPGIIVQSGNDACVVVAEGLAGTEDAFARLMNQRAEALGMNGSTFTNASGWPDPGHKMSVRDLAFLGHRMVAEFPEYYGFFAQESFTWEGITQQNRNPLLGLGIGVDGLKTGHTEAAGYGMVGSASSGKRRVVFVVAGLPSAAERARESEQLVNWAFRQFVEKKVVSEGTELARAKVWMGDIDEIGLIAPDDVTVLVSATAADTLRANISYRGPLEAPIKEGQELAVLTIERDGLPPLEVDLVADRDVARGGFLPRIRSSTRILLDRVGSQIQGFF